MFSVMLRSFEEVLTNVDIKLGKVYTIYVYSAALNKVGYRVGWLTIHTGTRYKLRNSVHACMFS